MRLSQPRGLTTDTAQNICPACLPLCLVTHAPLQVSLPPQALTLQALLTLPSWLFSVPVCKGSRAWLTSGRSWRGKRQEDM